MRNFLILVALSGYAISLPAQSVREEIQKNIRCSASNYMAYPNPHQHELTPAPEGKKPFYISHYGRHGSRYHNKPLTYEIPYQILAAADSLGKLTPLGVDVLHRLDLIRQDAKNHWGELTELGARQHREIIKRMVRHYPEIFQGRVSVDARSTMVTRCILSMEYAMMQLAGMVPTANIHHNATHRDMYYLNKQDKRLFAMKMDSATFARYKEFTKPYEDNLRLMQSLFNDTAYINNKVDAGKLNYFLFKVASNLQSTHLNNQMTLYDLFTDEEIYHNWKKENAWWYICYAGSTLNGGLQPYTQRNLLRRIIEQADSCIRLEQPGVQLRYGHETVLLPLVCLLEIEDYGLATDNLESLDRRGWANYRIFPMAANLQIVFYRKNPDDGDVLVKVLLNENEVHLPLKSVEEVYYHWSDFRKYYLKKLDAYVEQ
ncbi:MAG: histidine-type phosphatase [Prevotella sp.]|nr:histidine-type phosphatase [Prevotella sp.]